MWNWTHCLTLVVVAAVTCMAGGQQEATSPPSSTQPDSAPAAKPTAKPRLKAKAEPIDPNLLAGPKVEDEAQTRDVPRLRQQDGNRRNNDEVPFAMWVTALRGLGLSEDQQAQARTIAREFERTAREYRESQPDDLREIMRQARQMRERGEPVPRELREKLIKIEANAPKPQPYQERIWALLTPAQQDQMKATLEQTRANMRNRQAQRNPEMMNETPESMRSMPMVSEEQPGAATQPSGSMKDQSNQH